MKMDVHNVAFLTFFLLTYLPSQLISISSCVFENQDKGKIDLSTVGRTDGIPNWKNVKPDLPDGHGKVC